MRFAVFFIILLGLIVSNNAQVKNVQLLGQWNNPEIMGWYGDGAFNEVWGFVQGGQEYAVIGAANSTNIIKINDDNSLERVVQVYGRELAATHRDFHDYNGYLYEVCDQGNSTLRVYDMQYLPDSLHMVYDDSSLIARAHNIYIDQSSGLLYACGVTYGTFSNAMRVISLSNPEVPSLVYDYDFVDYVHDVFVRNDSAYINAGFDGLRIVDFSTPNIPMPLGSLEIYPDAGYNHSGWLSEDGNRYIMCDETAGMRFKLLDVSDVSDIEVLNYTKPNTFEQTLPHNIMMKNGLAYFSYYADGFQIYDVRNPGSLKRIAYYDTYQGEDVIFKGAWGIHIDLPSKRLLISDRTNGLFLFGFDAPPNLLNSDFEYSLSPSIIDQGYTYFYGDHKGGADYSIELFDDNGRIVSTHSGDGDYLRIDVSKLSHGVYFYRYVDHIGTKEASGKIVISNP